MRQQEYEGWRKSCGYSGTIAITFASANISHAPPGCHASGVYPPAIPPARMTTTNPQVPCEPDVPNGLNCVRRICSPRPSVDQRMVPANEALIHCVHCRSAARDPQRRAIPHAGFPKYLLNSSSDRVGRSGLRRRGCCLPVGPVPRRKSGYFGTIFWKRFLPVCRSFPYSSI